MLHWTTSLGSALGIVSTVLMITGGVLGWQGMRRLNARLTPGNAERRRRPSGPMLAVGAALLTAGVVLRVAFAHEIADRTTTVAEQMFVDTPAKFVSITAPGVALQAPPGWSLHFEPSKQELIAVTPVDGGIRAHFALSTTRIEDGVDLDALWRGMAAQVEKVNPSARIDAPTAEWVGGKRAIAFVVHRTDDESAVWFVQRGERLLSTIVCTAEKDGARKLCAEPLAVLRWLQ